MLELGASILSTREDGMKRFHLHELIAYQLDIDL